MGFPVSMLLPNGNTSHQTSIGGFCSIVMVLITLFITVSEFMRIFVDKDFSVETELAYLNTAANLDSYIVPSDSLILAVQVFNRY